LSRYPGAVEADLQRYYGIDLADMYRGRLTPRKVAVLVQYLPRGAVLWQLVGGPGAITAEEEALWGVHYLQQARMYQAGGNKGAEPKPRDYPTGVEEQKSAVDRIESNARAWREQQKNRHR
jgi:hypothetical protein